MNQNVQQENSVINKKKSFKPVIIALIALALVAIAFVVVIVVRSNSPERRYREQLSLGYRYLEEEDYRQAVAAFEAAIAIDPKNVEAYLGLVDVYVDSEDFDELPDLYDLASDNLTDDDLDDLRDCIFDEVEDEIKKALKHDDYDTASEYAEILSEIDKKEAEELMKDLLGDQISGETEPSSYDEYVPDEDMTVAEESDGLLRADILPYYDGEYIIFGAYEQDGDYSNGPEPIKWRVLKEEDGKLFLVSEYILDCMNYDDNSSDVTWENCTLRTWLNDDFLNSAFTSNEQNLIQTTLVETNSVETTHYGENGSYPITLDAGAPTNDKVFLLSIEEVEEYFDYYEQSYSYRSVYSDTIGYPTEFAVDMGCYYQTDDTESDWHNYLVGATWWWLRSTGDYDEWMEQQCMYGININGEIGTDVDFGFSMGLGGHGTYVSEYGGIRPAIWITIP